MDAISGSAVHTASRLGRLQQGVTLGAVLGAALWWGAWHAQAPLWAWVGVVGLLQGYAVVLAIEFGVMHAVNRDDPAPRLTPARWLRAWWAEVRVAPQVFSWRQPFRWRCLPDEQVASARGATAAVLVHGFVCNRGLWLPWLHALQRRGLPWTTVNLEPVFGSIDAYVPLIEEAVCRAEALTGRPPLLVCHSMGGLAARAWLAATPGAARRVCGVVTIGTPHHGTWLARFSHVTNGRQMQIGGEWLRALAAREAGQPRPPFVCWYSNADNIVFPASTATLAGADNRHLDGVPHVAMAFHPTVMATSLAMLASGGSSPSERTAS